MWKVEILRKWAWNIYTGAGGSFPTKNKVISLFKFIAIGYAQTYMFVFQCEVKKKDFGNLFSCGRPCRMIILFQKKMLTQK